MAKTESKTDNAVEVSENIQASSENENLPSNSPSFKFVQQANPPDETYADGPLGVISQGMIFKVDFYRFIGTEKETGIELRANSHRIVLPITAAPQLISILQNMLQKMETSGVLKREKQSVVEADKD